MRIGLVIYGDLNTLSGGFLYDRMLVEHLQSQGESVEVISLPWRTYGQHMTDNLSRGFFHRLAGADVDVLVQDELNHPSLFWINRRLRSRVGYPVASIVHHLRSSEMRPAWKNRFYRWIEGAYLRTVDAFIFNTDVTRRVVETHLTDARPSVVAQPGRDHLHPTVNEAQIVMRARQDGPLQILFVGNLIRRKGLHTLIDAAGRLPPGDWRLRVIGAHEADTAYAQTIRERIKELGLAKWVELLGKGSAEMVAEHLARSHLLVVPSSYEGFGIVYLEAKGFGVVPIAGDRGGASEIITDGKTGYLVPPEDPEKLADIIHRLCLDRSRLEDMGVRARRSYASHPTWAGSGERIRSFLRDLVPQ